MRAVSAYSSTQAHREGDDLVVRHAGLVKRIAFHLAARLPSSVDVEDLIQAGMIGLLEAAAGYSADRGATFETFAGIRIRGAMIDTLRQLDWTPRSVHRQSREAAAAIRAIESETGREARDVEIAARKLKEIGLVLKVSDSRVCQMHGQALTRLKARLASWAEKARDDIADLR